MPENLDLEPSTGPSILALEKVLADTQARITQLEQVCVQIKRSIATLSGYANPQPKAKVLIAKFFMHATEAMTPNEIYHGMLVQGLPIRKGSLYTTLRRMAAHGQLTHNKQENTYSALSPRRHAS